MDTRSVEEVTRIVTEPRARGVPMRYVAVLQELLIDWPDIRPREVGRKVMTRLTISPLSKPPNFPKAAQIKFKLAYMKQ